MASTNRVNSTANMLNNINSIISNKVNINKTIMTNINKYNTMSKMHIIVRQLRK